MKGENRKTVEVRVGSFLKTNVARLVSCRDPSHSKRSAIW